MFVHNRMYKFVISGSNITFYLNFIPYGFLICVCNKNIQISEDEIILYIENFKEPPKITEPDK